MDEKKKQGGWMPMQKDITWSDLENGIYNFSAPPVGFQSYMVVGSQRALVIDTGMGVGSLKKVVEQITDLPAVVVNTHGHPDHVGGNAEFSSARMCPADLDVFEQMGTLEYRTGNLSHMPGQADLIPQLQPTAARPAALEDGELIDLGGRILQVIYTPGHTPGSICLLDRQTGTLFAGDNVQRKTELKEWNSATIETYYESLCKLEALHPKCILGGHKPNINGPDLLTGLLHCAKAILDGARGEEKKSWDGSVSLTYEMEGACISYTAENIR